MLFSEMVTNSFWVVGLGCISLSSQCTNSIFRLKQKAASGSISPTLVHSLARILRLTWNDRFFRTTCDLDADSLIFSKLLCSDASEAWRSTTVVPTAKCFAKRRAAGGQGLWARSQSKVGLSATNSSHKTVRRTRRLRHMPGDDSVKKHKVGCPPRHKVPK